ncbi:dTMP kinase [Mycoplasmoides pneumoniae]|uniref:dTMP kinase n=1 Tax=Mycoplasmoides pneumoniae TaxID=2104 RepID=UPI00137645C6|nr:dTMP kinase [Mycoplasmoides pneumoniae]QHR11281.1 dTMP kinase [Mycoplasmoides pneumoniae]
MKQGVFVAIEGVDGAGKTVLLEAFKQRFPQSFLGFKTLFSREPGGTPLAEKIRALLLHEAMEPLTEAYLFAASRTEHVRQLIQPALQQKQLVIVDRFVWSSYAYQGLIKKVGLDVVKKLNADAVGDSMPDFTFIVDCDFETALNRMAKRDQDNLLDNTVKKQADFNTMRQYYHSLVDNKRVFLLDGQNQTGCLEQFIEQLSQCLTQPTLS